MAEVIKISDAASLGFHAMMMLADHDDGGLLTTHEIAERFKISENHLSKVLQRLTRAGLVSAERGPRGGFKIAKGPSDITLLDVFEAIEGPLEATTCLLGTRVCGRARCILGGLLEDVNRNVRDYLSGTKLSDLVESEEPSPGFVEPSGLAAGEGKEQ